MAAPHPFRHTFHTFRGPLGSSLSFAQPALRHSQLHIVGSIARIINFHQVSCPSHSFRGAPPKRGGDSHTMLFIRFRAPPTSPGRPRLSEESIRKP
eukprot:5385408-Pyramimonas_sp.AAC.1